MSEIKPSSAFILSLIGSILTIINGLWIAIINQPIIISTSKASSLDEIMNSEHFWGRIAFGIPGLLKGLWIYFWIIFSFLMLILTFIIYRKPRRYRIYGLLVAIFALFSLPIGGGFYIGTIFGFIGGLNYLEWPKSLGETFLGRIFRAARGETKFFGKVYEEPEILNIAVLELIFIGFLSGIGNGLYVYNADIIKNGGSLAFQILSEGYILWNEMVLFSAISMIGVMILKWLILSTCIYWIGAKLIGLTSSYDKVSRVVAFAFVPEIIMVFMPLIFSNEPALSFNWPIGLYAISRLWMFACLLVAIKQMFDFSTMRAFGVALFGGTIYWMIYHMFIVPTLNVPGFRINISMPESSTALLVLIGLISLVATAAGIFSRRQVG
ncbi:MAG: hypothetical protein QW670_03685 [Candidatus Bathyarchaeia archaeon]